MLNTVELKKYARLYLARKKIREKDKELTEELTKMQDVLLQHMATEEIDKFDFKGGITVSTKTLIWPKCLIKNDVGNGDRKAMIKGSEVEQKSVAGCLAGHIQRASNKGDGLLWQRLSRSLPAV